MKMTNRDLTKEIMEKIHKQQVIMHSPWYFIAGAFMVGLGLAGAAAVSIFFADPIVDDLRYQQPFHHLWVDRFGWSYVFSHLPWLDLVLAIIGLVGGYLLLKRFELVYKRSRLLVIIGLVLSVIILALILDDANPNHSATISNTREGWIEGTIISINFPNQSWKIAEGNYHTAIVYWNSQTRFEGGHQFKPGDGIELVAHSSNGHLLADSVEKETSIIDYH